MRDLKNRFTIKILLGYLTLGIIAAVVGSFLFSEIKNYSEEIKPIDEQKLVETGTLINLLYKTDRFSRLALLTENDEDYELYNWNNDSLFLKIEELKLITSNVFQRKQLDSIKALLEAKNQNLEQLRILRLTNQKETSLDDIMDEVRKLEASVGFASVESMVREPWKLTPRERRIWQSYADYLNSSKERDTVTVKSKVVDSMLIASRYIVAEAKKENSRIRESLRQKENELIRNDLDISERLRIIIAGFDAEIKKSAENQAQARAEALEKTGQILKFAAVLGIMTVLLFSYFVLADFFKAERYKKYLEDSKKYVESLLKSREQLISTVSHDLNTPLNTISGYSELLDNTALSDKQQNYVNQIKTSTVFISSLVNDLLDFSKLEAGQIIIEKHPFLLDNLIFDTGEAVKQAYKKPDVALKIQIDKTIENRLFESDPLRIRQIVTNLLSNAFKFTKKGTVSVHVKHLETVGDTAQVQLIVEDTGIGISKEKQEAIFEEFRQADESILMRFGGSGLGLTITKKLTELLGGNIQVESEIDSGSRFIVTLPLKKVNKSGSKISEKTNQKHIYQRGVIIDDDSGMRSLLKEALNQRGIDCYSFESYADFKQSDKTENLKYDFILTDIQMPETDGFQVLEELKNKQIRSYKNQEIFAMTGNQQFEKDYFLKKGFAAILKKPFPPTELLELLQQTYGYSYEPLTESKSTHIKKSSDIYSLDMLYSFVEEDEKVKEIIQELQRQTVKDLKSLDKAVKTQTLAIIQNTAHRMLTMYRQIHARKVICILEKMENSSNFEEAKNEVEKLKAALKELWDELNPTTNYQHTTIT